MATKSKTPATTDEQTPVAEQQTPVAPPTDQPTADPSALQAEIKRLRDQLKQAKSAAPSQTKLEREIARQTANPTNYIHVALARRIATRVRLGQDRDQATDEVWEQYRGLVEAEVDRVLAEGAASETTEGETASE